MSTTLAAPRASAFNTNAPRMSVEEISAVLLEFYGIETSVKLLTSERDLTAHATEIGGRREFVFKVANSSEDPSVVDFQNRALDHIQRAVKDVPVPRVIRSRSGASQIDLELGSNRHVARVLSYLQGVPVHLTHSTRSQREALGTALARLTLALKDYRHAAAGHEILWDLKHSAILEEHTSSIEDAYKQRHVAGIFAKFREQIKPIEGHLRHQVVHNDFNQHNVLVDQNDHSTVSGILDFGDLVDTPVIYDVAVGCSYHLPSSGHPLSLATEFLSAYHRRNPLFEGEIDLLFDMINTRNAMTVTITEWRAKLYPDNSAYILKNNPRATRALEQYASISAEEARIVFRTACGFH